MKSQKSIPFGALAAVWLAVLVIYNLGSLHAIVFSVTDGLWGNWPSLQLNCPVRADLERFKQRVTPARVQEVGSIEECLNEGERLKIPLVCQLRPATESSNADLSKRLLAAIEKDTSYYQLICRDGGDVHFLRPEYKRNSTIQHVLAEPSECAGGFIYGDEHEALLSEAYPALNKTFSPDAVASMSSNKSVLFSTSFVSNFPGSRISTGTHAAMVVSLAFQLVGKKVWLLHSLEKSSSHYWHRTAWRLWPNCLQEWLSGMKTPYVATTGPGDILYFPLAYQHLVYSEKGLNVMTNIRYIRKYNPVGLLTYFSFSNLLKIVADRVFLGKSTGNPR